jgi:hypothetical protein
MIYVGPKMMHLERLTVRRDASLGSPDYIENVADLSPRKGEGISPDGTKIRRPFTSRNTPRLV